jgi:sugar phosphate isomerase/epimerase
MHISRRDFGKVAAAALPLAHVLGKTIDSKINGVQIGVQSYSYRDLPLDQAIQGMVTDGLGECELFSPHIEGGDTEAPMKQFAFKKGMSRDEMKKLFAEHEEKMRKWRLSVPMSYFHGIRQKFDNAGIKLYAYNLSLGLSASDEEIERGFEMVKALGANIWTSSTTVSMAKRMAPFADKHDVLVAFHGHSDVKDPEQFSTPETFAKAMAMSKQYRINLDIGHFTAAGFDPLDYIQKHHQSIVILHLKDRKKNDGPNTPWGEGDTPIKQVLQLLKTKRYNIPAEIEYEYEGKGSSVEEVAKCVAYIKEALNPSA